MRSLYTGKATLRQAFRRLEDEVPAKAGRALRSLRHPNARWIRIPLGVLLVLGGIFSILPFLGIWMLPLGLVLLALDVALLRRPTVRMLVAGERLWNRLRKGRRAGNGEGSTRR